MRQAHFCRCSGGQVSTGDSKSLLAEIGPIRVCARRAVGAHLFQLLHLRIRGSGTNCANVGIAAMAHAACAHNKCRTKYACSTRTPAELHPAASRVLQALARRVAQFGPIWQISWTELGQIWPKSRQIRPIGRIWAKAPFLCLQNARKSPLAASFEHLFNNVAARARRPVRRGASWWIFFGRARANIHALGEYFVSVLVRYVCSFQDWTR